MHHRRSLTRRLVTAAFAGYAANAAYGVAVAAGAVGGRRVRWAHHALFVITATLTTAATAAAATQRRTAGLALLPAAAMLAAMPRTRGGTTGHVRLAVAAAPWFLIAALMAARGDRLEVD